MVIIVLTEHIRTYVHCSYVCPSVTLGDIYVSCFASKFLRHYMYIISRPFLGLVYALPVATCSAHILLGHTAISVI